MANKAILELLGLDEDQRQEPASDEPPKDLSENGPPDWVTPEMEAQIAEEVWESGRSYDPPDDQAGERVGVAETPPTSATPSVGMGHDPTLQVSTSGEAEEERIVEAEVDFNRDTDPPEEEPEPEEETEEDAEDEEGEPSRPLPTFRILATVRTWKQWAKALKAINGEVPLSFTKDGCLRVLTVDPAHVAMVDARFLLEEVDYAGWELAEPDARKPSETPYGVNVEQIEGFLKGLPVDDTVEFAFEERDSREEPRFTLRSDMLETHFPALDSAGYSQPQVPNLDLAATVEIAAGDLKKAVKAMETVSDHVAFIADPDVGFVVSTEGYVADKQAVFPRDRLVRLDVRERQRSFFAIDYLEMCLKGLDLKSYDDEVIRIHLDTDYPVRIEYELDGADFMFLAAPRIESA